MLRFVGLVASDGRPTDLWDTIREPTTENRIRFAGAIRRAYTELFQLYPDAHRKDNETLRVFFLSRAIGGEVVQSAVLRTFRALVQFGDFESGADSPTHSYMDLPEFVSSVAALDADAQRLLTTYEVALSRLEALEATRKRIEAFSQERNLLLQESLRAAQAGLFRASHVLAWSEFADYLAGLVVSVDAQRRWQNDDTLINIARDLHLYDEATSRTLRALLVDRNQCAHASEYNPTVIETATYLGKLIGVMEDLRKRYPPDTT